MRLVRNLFILMIVGVSLGYGAYYFGQTEAAENSTLDMVEDVEETGVIAQLKKLIPTDIVATVFKADNEPSSSEEKSVPITSKAEAVKVVVSRVGLTGLQEIESKVRSGDMTEAEIRQIAEENFTDEEIKALEAILLQEMN